MRKKDPIKVIDLFCGCGGFSLGLENAGLKTIAAIDFNKEAIEVYKKNFPNVPYVLQCDLTNYPPEKLAEHIKTNKVDLIVGGPPCQGFSTVRQVGGSNQGPRLIEDKRRYLYKEFIKYVKYFTPKVFIMENVLGIKSADCGRYYRLVQAEFRELGYRVHGYVLNASDYGIPQKRKRQLIIGTKKELPVYFYEKYLKRHYAKRQVTLGEAICDLPELSAGQGDEESFYDLNLREMHIEKYGTEYIFNVLKANEAVQLTAHRARPHNNQDLRDFSKIREGENGGKALARGEELESTYNKNCFSDRYTRQSRNQLCSTIVAHLSKDGLMFIHPTQNRSLTPREAARVQSFPDTFQFPVSRTHQYKLIGNAVPPLLGKSVGSAIIDYLNDVKAVGNNEKIIKQSIDVPINQMEAANRLMELIIFAKNDTIRKVPKDKFRNYWYAFGYLYPSLHPDSICDNKSDQGKSYKYFYDLDEDIKSRYIELATPFYIQSGYPLALVPVIKEAMRRYRSGMLKDKDLYCISSLYGGIKNKYT